MDFELNEEQQAFADMARAFAEKELAPHAGEWDRQALFPVDVLKKAGELGFCGLYTAEEHGGMGLSRLDSHIIFEQLAMGCTSTTAYLTIHNMVTWMVATFGSDGVRDRYAAELISGEKLGSYCLTEPNAGSDAASLKTTARREGDHYVVNGSKCFISGAGSTEVLVVMARTGGAGAAGISALVIDADSAGISYGRKEDKLGWNSQPTRMITFDDVKVPAANLLATEGEGFKLAMKGLDGGRINIATCSLGTAQQALNEARAYMLERRQFGKRLADFQALQFKLADMVTELVAARQLVRLAASKLDQGHADASTYCAMAKRFATDAGYRVCDEALQLHGGNGYIKEYPLERYLRDSRVHRILEGTNEVMRLIISRRLLVEGAAELL
ncbi:acyl-CoA dehydrogenase family protein [Marinobacterium rhizophilum]|uniref:Acyl-CoA dehydrogenase family protein n=1 Tax=Marinobacterium rhizophilum TaxID=420402 RepID=A0ABY5HSD2_9GAMM|nr:acyl-CoA dehydrogenase family protein [Marinobacterium rhizophilum]UTW13851.1 acyl-CoA dehydrogenase family protein [Marinobacterium rhizophilum]